MAQIVKTPPTIQEMQVQSLGREDPLEKERATHSSIPAWSNPWTEEPGGATVYGVAKSRTRLRDGTLPCQNAAWVEGADSEKQEPL